MKFAGPTGQRRAKISGNWLTVFLVRARGAAPGGPRTKSTPTDPRATPGRPPGDPREKPPERSRSAPTGLEDVPESPKKGQEAPKGPPRWCKRAPGCRRIAPRRPRWPPDAPRGLQEHSQEGPQKEESTIFRKFSKDIRVLALSASRRSKTAEEAPQDRPKTAQDGPKTVQEHASSKISKT